MADQRLTDKDLMAEYNDADLVHIVDVSDTDSDPSGTSKKGTWTQIKAFLEEYFNTIYITQANVRSRTVIESTFATTYDLDISAGIRWDLTATSNISLTYSNIVKDGDSNQIYLTLNALSLTLPSTWTAYPNSEDITGATLIMIVFDVLVVGDGEEIDDDIRYHITVLS